MKNGKLNTFLICAVVFTIATGIDITLFQTGYSWSTHMTLHNLADNASELSIVAASSCTAQVNTNCEAGAEYVWYNIDVFTPPKDQQTPKCTVNPIIAGLKPPQNQTNTMQNQTKVTV